MRKPCSSVCNVQITCSCCNIQFSCVCSLHIHFIKDKNVQIVSKQYIEIGEANSEITERCLDLHKVDGSTDDDNSFVPDTVSPLEYRDELEKTSKNTRVVNPEEISRSVSSIKDHLYIDNVDQQAKHDADDETISEGNEWPASAEGQCNEESSYKDSRTTKKMKDTEGLKRGKLLSSNIKVPCDICGHVFKKRNLKRHMQSHATTKEFTCEICQKVFRTESSLHGHQLHHRTKKDLICHFCGKQFNNGPNLRQHIKSHTRERTLKCPLCPKMFGSNYVLKDHVSRHSGEKPHTCTICNRSFRKPQEVKRHMTFHSDARDHMCRICEKRFKSKSNLVKHEKIHDRKKKTKSEI
ncbi:zinc finger and BTB domain-containing protein 24-like isoform X2 [Mercenaria mercenaria]|uniref:zinc finger and BTB domain-containing protein 24-like isoform X2 n=1 Tax=Mercenaria mercenaria TaxID=6596 RepID=UPI00234F8831|nr:zinc finger and BTB domain-containing protein 24-like isoform X2 [Mercenaria mercenaria]